MKPVQEPLQSTSLEIDWLLWPECVICRDTEKCVIIVSLQRIVAGVYRDAIAAAEQSRSVSKAYIIATDTVIVKSFLATESVPLDMCG